MRMQHMMEDKRTAFLQSPVRAVTKHGMKDVSTRSISSDAGVNDVYIYRYFKDTASISVCWGCRSYAYFLKFENKI